MKSILRHFSLAALLLVTPATLLPASPGKPMTNADVIALAKAELPESTITAAINRNTHDFDLSAEGLIALKSAGVSPKVIEAMLMAGAVNTTVPTAQPASVPSPTEAELRALLNPKVAEESNGAMTVVLVRKTNGQSGVESGVAIYNMAFEAVFGANTEFAWDGFFPLRFKVVLPGSSSGKPKWQADMDRGMFNMAPGYHASPGTLFRIRGTATFEQSERGWVLSSLRATGDSGYTAAGIVETVDDESTINEVNRMQNEARNSGLQTAPKRDSSPNNDNSPRQNSVVPMVLNTEEFRAQLAELPSLAPGGETVKAGGRFTCVVPEGLPQNPEWTQETETTTRLACTTPGCKSLGGDGEGFVALWEKRTWGSRNTKITHLTEGQLNKPNIQNRRTIGPVPVKVGGQDGLAVLVQGDLAGHPVCYVDAYACSKTHFDHVFMYVRVEGFAAQWPKYRQFLASYTLLPEAGPKQD